MSTHRTNSRSTHRIIIENIRNYGDEEYGRLLEQLYRSDEEVKLKADDIHHSRLCSGDVCHQCIAMALGQLAWKVTATFEIRKP